MKKKVQFQLQGGEERGEGQYGRGLRSTNSSVQLLSCVQHFSTPWNAACQASLSITNSQSLLKLMSIALMMPSNHLILCYPLLLLLSFIPTIRVFSKESALLHQVVKELVKEV